MIAKHNDDLHFNLATLESLWRQSSDIILEYDSELRLISTNPAGQEFLEKHLKKVDLLGHTNEEIFGGQLGSEMDRALIEAASRSKTSQLEFQVPGLEGLRTLESIVVTAKDRGSSKTTQVMVHRDITDKRDRFRQMADQLESQKEFLSTIINTSPGPIYVKNQKGEYTMVNQATCDFWGRPRSELLGKTDLELNEKSSTQFRIQDMSVLRSSDFGFAFEEEVISPSDGEKRYYQTTKRPMRDPVSKEVFVLGNSIDITKIKQDQAIIQKNEKLLESIISKAPMIVAAIDTNGTITFSAGKGLAQLKLTPGENVGKSVFDVYAGYPDVVEAIRKVLKERTEVKGVFHIKDRVFESSLVPVSNEGLNQGLICIAYDVTERHKAESALKFTQLSIDRSGEAAFWIDSKGSLIYVNDRASELSGYTREELLKMNIFQISPSKHSERWSLNWRKIKKAGSATAESELIRKDGRRIPIEVSQNFIRFDNEEFDCAFVKDISERKNAEQTLLENEKRFRELSDSSPSFIWMFDHKAACQYVNKTYRISAGEPESKILGLAWKSCVHPEDLPRALKLLTDPSLEEISFEIRVLVQDKGYRWIFAKGIQRKNEQGRFEGFLVSGIDVTERKQGVDALHKAAKELERSNQELEQFAYVASHDLQEPLRMITGFCELLHEQYRSKLDEQGEEYLAYILDGAHRMSVLIRDLLIYSRSGKVEKRYQDVDTKTVIEVAKRNLRFAIEKSHADIQVLTDLPILESNENQLVQVFQNLIDNAIKYRGEERPPKVEISAELKDDMWIFKVQDNGRGFDMRHRERIFHIFQRLMKKESISGSGIGLSISKKIIEGFRGQIWAESSPGVGSSFYFSHPKGTRSE